MTISRRRVLEGGLLAGVAAALPAPLPAGSALAPLITKVIPATGEAIPVIGIGTNHFGSADGKDVRAVLSRMHEAGGTVIDTAGRYAGSEAALGPALHELGLQQKMFIVTKLNAPGATNDPPFSAIPGQPPDPVSGIDSFERSLQRLQVQKVDVLMAHWLSSVEPMMPLLFDLKKAGRVRYIGITTVKAGQHPRLAGFMRKYPVDFVQVEYSLNDRSAEQEVFPLAIERRMAVMAALPFGGDQNGLFSKVGKRALPGWAADFGIASWAQLFLKYVVSHPAVTCAIPGSTKVSHLLDNQGAGFGRLPDAATRRRIEAFWKS
jgi:aryl-alcohol dehydrogenase-like predicted oxidoreductase